MSDPSDKRRTYKSKAIEIAYLESQVASLQSELEICEEDLKVEYNKAEDLQCKVEDLQSKLSQQGWVSVEDRLPEHGQTVQIVVDGVVGFASYNKTLGFPTLYFGSQEAFGHIVTHWMPLPSPPEDK